MQSGNSMKVTWVAVLAGMALLVSGAAQAVIDFTGDRSSTITYALETVTSETEDSDGNKYYVVIGDGEGLLNAQVAMPSTATTERTVFVDVMLGNMIFTAMSQPGLVVLTDTTTCGTTNPGTPVAIDAGGAAGDDMVSFAIETSVPRDDPTGTRSILCVTIDQLAVSMGTGTVTVSVVNDRRTRPQTTTATHGSAVRLARTLSAAVMPNDATALVTTGFKSFRAGMGTTAQAALMGSFMVGAADMAGPDDEADRVAVYRDADDGALVNFDALVNGGTATPNGTDLATVSNVMISGNFSFASSVWLNAAASDCDTPGIDIRMPLDRNNMRDTTKLRAQSLAYINGNPRLCIGVPAADSENAMAIPETAPYMVEIMYMLDSAFGSSKFPPSMATHYLGRIMRDGTTVELPYLTQFSVYNQRIVVRNRGAAARYSFDFDAESGVTVTPGMDAEGMLMPGLTYFSLMHGDLVTIEGSPNRAAATLTVESQPGLIDVLISQTNAGGTTDTVRYTRTHNE